MADVAALLERGQLNRKIGETMMNSESSRSHRYLAIFSFDLSCVCGVCHFQGVLKRAKRIILNLQCVHRRAGV